MWYGILPRDLLSTINPFTDESSIYEDLHLLRRQYLLQDRTCGKHSPLPQWDVFVDSCNAFVLRIYLHIS